MHEQQQALQETALRQLVALPADHPLRAAVDIVLRQQEIRSLPETTEPYHPDLNSQLTAATEWIRVVGEEMVLAGLPGGDRANTLANLRQLRQERDELRNALLNFMGLLDNAIYRRRMGDDWLYRGAIDAGRKALGEDYRQQPQGLVPVETPAA